MPFKNNKDQKLTFNIIEFLTKNSLITYQLTLK